MLTFITHLKLQVIHFEVCIQAKNMKIAGNLAANALRHMVGALTQIFVGDTGTKKKYANLVTTFTFNHTQFSLHKYCINFELYLG